MYAGFNSYIIHSEYLLEIAKVSQSFKFERLSNKYTMYKVAQGWFKTNDDSPLWNC